MVKTDDMRAVSKFGTPKVGEKTRETFLKEGADEIDRLRLLARMLADEDANGVAYMLCEHPHLSEIFEPEEGHHGG